MANANQSPKDFRIEPDLSDEQQAAAERLADLGVATVGDARQLVTQNEITNHTFNIPTPNIEPTKYGEGSSYVRTGLSGLMVRTPDGGLAVDESAILKLRSGIPIEKIVSERSEPILFTGLNGVSLGSPKHGAKANKLLSEMQQRRSFSYAISACHTMFGEELDKEESESPIELTTQFMLDSLIHSEADGNKSFAIDGVLLSPKEYSVVVRNPRAWSSRIAARSLSGSRSGNFDVHSIKVNKLQELVKGYDKLLNVVEAKTKDYEELRNYIKNPGLALTEMSNLHELISKLSSDMDGLLELISVDNGLDAKQTAALKASLHRSLVRGDESTNIESWNNINNIAIWYNRRKTQMYLKYRAKAQEHLTELG